MDKNSGKAHSSIKINKENWELIGTKNMEYLVKITKNIEILL